MPVEQALSVLHCMLHGLLAAQPQVCVTAASSVMKPGMWLCWHVTKHWVMPEPVEAEVVVLVAVVEALVVALDVVVVVVVVPVAVPVVEVPVEPPLPVELLPQPIELTPAAATVKPPTDAIIKNAFVLIRASENERYSSDVGMSTSETAIRLAMRKHDVPSGYQRARAADTSSQRAGATRTAESESCS
jgi:hypothetical protein